MNFWVQMKDVDDENEWAAVSAGDAEAAAEEYAELRDNNSGGELLRDEDDRQIVLVKEQGSIEVQRFEVHVSYSKIYVADETIA